MNVALLLMAVLLSLWAMGLSLCKCKSPLLCTCLQILKTQRMVQVVIMSVLEQCRGMHVHGLVASEPALGGSLWTVLSKKSKFSTYACYLSQCPALSTYQQLTHKPRASYGHALGLSDWRLVSGFDCVGTPE